MAEKKNGRRSQAWFGGTDKRSTIHRAWMLNQGTPPDNFDGRPVIGICNTWSEFTPCNAHLRDLAERVKRGVLEAGGVAFEFPVMSLGESSIRPTAMLFRNLASMDVEESIRANPMDGVVLLCGCDKTTPSLVMGAASCDLPTIVVSGGPMLNGKHRGCDVGSGTAVWKMSEDMRAGEMSPEAFMDAEQAMSRSAGSCMTMGTASTMASMMEAIGLALPQNAATPAVDARRRTLSQYSGRQIVDLVRRNIRMSDIVTRRSLENAIRVNAAIGGSTNAILHMIAIAGRLELSLTSEDWDEIGRDIPTILNLQPSGKYLMEDFYYAGGLPVVMKYLLDRGLLHGDAKTVSGMTVGDQVEGAENFNDDVIRSDGAPLTESGGIAVLRGNLAPLGAVIKPSAATAELMQHTGPAVVFEDIDDYKARIDDPDLDVSEDSVLVLKNCGPKGYPGMAEVGNMGLPSKLLKQGVRDMVRISDARMSGTAFGTIVLHAAPEAAAGGPLALVRDGDIITLDVEKRRLELQVSDEELNERLKFWTAPDPAMRTGYQKLYVDHVLQADRGVDLDFLVGKRGADVPRDSH
ncbi:IlvD/Edd family dehydratase [Hoeflea prorocentri]|uniref:Dihydroxy-acid dehydratase n=1 Tax=Hoeflea prorocentri TaxID=1922333 RepID=A0A9X3UMV8_9HYPH|nr:IlvD/Edd family dehydratase [Hoeflea prorocentri]MCY6383785.1 dihydroxy-acid dehydratase [Hoeflea prorocentri]MDA5401585.1 dihydroxy-acid dehydratase [Hoeflea prorocentri]